MGETPSTEGASVTPTPTAPPATGTSNTAPGSATPPTKPSVSIEDALARIAELEHANKNATEERDRHRKKLSTYEEAEKKAQDAQLSEVERIKKQHADLQVQHDTYVRTMQERLIKAEIQLQASKLHVIDPGDAAKLLDWSELEYDEDGMPKNADKLLEKLLKAKPYLALASQQQTEPTQNGTTPAQNPTRPNTPALPAMNPGRTTITPPGQAPGQHPSKIGWGDVYKRP